MHKRRPDGYANEGAIDEYVPQSPLRTEPAKFQDLLDMDDEDPSTIDYPTNDASLQQDLGGMNMSSNNSFSGPGNVYATQQPVSNYYGNAVYQQQLPIGAPVQQAFFANPVYSTVPAIVPVPAAIPAAIPAPAIQASPFNPFLAKSTTAGSPTTGIPVVQSQPRAAAPPNNDLLSLGNQTRSNGPVVLDPFSKTSGSNDTVPVVAPKRASMPPITVSTLVNPMQQATITKAGPPSPTRSADLFSLSMQTGYVAPKVLVLTAQVGRGLEVLATCKLMIVNYSCGSVACRHSQMFLEMTLINRSLNPLKDFAILFNVNT